MDLLVSVTEFTYLLLSLFLGTTISLYACMAELTLIRKEK